MQRELTAHVIAVLGSGGGSGASTLAAALAVRAAADGIAACLVDLDEAAGGLDVLVGLETEPGLRWGDLAGAEGEIVADSVCMQLPSLGDGGPSVLAHETGGPRVDSDLAERVLTALASAVELVIVDLPHGGGSVGFEADDLLLVVRGAVPGVAAAGAMARRLADGGASPRLVVRDAGRHGASSIADAVGLPLAAELRSDGRLDSDVERGLPPGIRRRSHLRRVAGDLLVGVRVAESGAA